MTRISSTFRRLNKQNEAALIPYVTVGYPSLDVTRRLVPIMGRQGADLIELGVPFSDPLADGATVQRASHAALENGVSLEDCLGVAAEVRRANEVPLLFMSYYNPIHRYGIERFAADCAAAGIDGLIVPDLPPEEAGPLKDACSAYGLDVIFLVAPTSTDERLSRVAELASGFIYCVSLAGVTGARTELGEQVDDLVARVRRYTDLPLVVGFGISTPEHVARVAAVADGAVVGSALINLLESAAEDDMILEVSDYIRSLKEATRRTTSAG
jgi:tryptophan synthase alpha chain